MCVRVGSNATYYYYYYSVRLSSFKLIAFLLDGAHDKIQQKRKENLYYSCNMCI